jgi:16S rRNA A1518/A1519 N6-dimethyltransferase RsmA/KsgA/DIM1 with predicted DNA glycosylase/AP lyase activity
VKKKRGKKKFKAKIDRKYLYIALTSIILSLSLFFLNFTTAPDNPPPKTVSKSTEIDKNNSLPKSDDMIKKMRDILSKSRKELKKRLKKTAQKSQKMIKTSHF